MKRLNDAGFTLVELTISILIISVVVPVTSPKPNETSGSCRGNKGANSVAMVTPSGCTRARNSPAADSLKLVCSGAPGTTRSFRSE